MAFIDPRIALSYQNAQVPDPIDVRTRSANLKTIANQQQLQQGDITALGQENQQRQKAIDDQKALDAAISANTSADPVTQAPIINHSGVVSSLARGGQGGLALKYQAGVTSLQQADVTLKEAQDKLRSEHIAHVGAGAGAVLDADPNAQPFVYQRALKQWIAAGDVKDGELPPQWNDQTKAALTVLRKAAMTAAQQSTEKYNEGRISNAETRADAAVQGANARVTQANAAQERAEQGAWKPNGSRNGNALYYNPATGAEKVGGPIDLTEPGGGGGGGETAAGRNARERANQTDYEKAQGQETKFSQLRSRLDSAINQGNVYVDRLGNVRPFSTMKNTAGDPLEDSDIRALKSDMQQQRAEAQTGLENAVTNKNNALQRNGVAPGVSTADAIARYRGEQQPGAAAQYLKFATGPNGARIGFNKATRKWEPIQK